MKLKALRAAVAQAYSEKLAKAHAEYMAYVAGKIIEFFVNADECSEVMIDSWCHHYRAQYDMDGSVIVRNFFHTGELCSEMNGSEAIDWLYKNREEIRTHLEREVSRCVEDEELALVPEPHWFKEEVFMRHYGDLKAQATAEVYAGVARYGHAFVSAGHVRNNANVSRGERVDYDELPAIRGSKRLLEGRNAMYNLYDSNKWENGSKRSHCQVRAYKVARKQARVAKQKAKDMYFASFEVVDAE